MKKKKITQVFERAINLQGFYFNFFVLYILHIDFC